MTGHYNCAEVRASNWMFSSKLKDIWSCIESEEKTEAEDIFVVLSLTWDPVVEFWRISMYCHDFGMLSTV